MTDKETLREALERLHWNGFWDGTGVMFPTGKDCEESFAKYDGILADIEAIIQQRIDAAIATMFERLRTPSEGMIEAGVDRVRHFDLEPHLAEAVWQAMLAAFQQENSDGR